MLKDIKKYKPATSLVAQRLRLCTSSAGSTGSVGELRFQVEKNQKQYCIKFNKDLKNGPLFKKSL